MDLKTIQSLHQASETKIVMLVIDGLGGLPHAKNSMTELEAAHTPNMDDLVAKSICGLHTPVADGITPGSGPAHLGLFGYDPLQYQVGRGTLGALGINFDLRPEDVAARGNFCTVDENGQVTDRRAGRISTEKCEELCRLLQKIELPDIQVFISPVQDYRFVLVFRGKGLSADISDTDPQVTGKAPFDPDPLNDDAASTADRVRQFIDQAREILGNRHPANMVLLRGFSKLPDWPKMPDVFGLRCAAIAAYPMYRGLSRLVGMEIMKTGNTLEDEIQTLEACYNDFDFFYIHFKATDSAGEDGDFDRKVSLIEEVDKLFPEIKNLAPDVLVVTGDHSTPAVLKSHSWHPVPVMLYSDCCRPDNVTQFGERACLAGALGPRLPATHLMPLALANARRLKKFGA